MCKTRLVELGSIPEIFGLLMELYDCVIFIEPVWALLSLAQVKGWSIRQAHFKAAILNAYFDIEEEIWIKVPNIAESTFVGQLVKLVKSLYGLRQASNFFYEYLYSFIVDFED